MYDTHSWALGSLHTAGAAAAGGAAAAAVDGLIRPPLLALAFFVFSLCARFAKRAAKRKDLVLDIVCKVYLDISKYVCLKKKKCRAFDMLVSDVFWPPVLASIHWRPRVLLCRYGGYPVFLIHP